MIDLRSDTVTRPSAAMRKAMMEADVGDDVFGEDPTVNRLQEAAAELLGKEAALFTPSGVMANQIGIRCNTEAGDEIIVERDSHILNYETAAPALISGVQILPVAGERGILKLAAIEAAVRPTVYYLPRTSLICLENTHNRAGGTIFPLDEMKRISVFAVEKDIRVHLDGARLWHAWVATGIHPREYGNLVDSVSVCFSKGLGAPVGSLLAGSKVLIEKARKIRKVLGGGMRQAGILAAAALYALEHNVTRLKEDHENARAFCDALEGVKGIKVRKENVETNMVLVDISGTGKKSGEVLARLKSAGVLLIDVSPTVLRSVMHMDVSHADVLKAAEIIKRTIAQ
ncbi:MAG TPA: low-specificity L-threonine aldolase [Bacteroidota bacterium]